MKRMIIGLAMILICGVACKKSITNQEAIESIKIKTRGINETIQFNGHDYQIKNGMLNFETFDAYEKLFDLKEPNDLLLFAEQVKNADNMISYIESSTDENKTKGLEFIGSLVNKFGLIKIDVYTLLLDFDAKKVFATKLGNISDLMNAKSGFTSNNVSCLSMENHDVIEELREQKTRGILCGDRWAISMNAYTPPMPTLVSTAGGAIADIQTGVAYIKAGIYFCLQVDSYCPQWAALSGGTNVPRNIVWNYYWKRRCGTSDSGAGSSSQTQSLTTVNNRYLKIVYGNVRALKHYSLTSTITSVKSLIPGDSKTITISN